MSRAPDDTRTSRRPPPVALTVAGSDSGGGAGIQADLKTFEAYGVFGTSAITAVTAQNTLGVTGVQKIDPEMVAAQIHAVAEDLHPAAVKSGMLADGSIIRAVAGALADAALETYVLDPVMVAASGDPLLEEDAVEALADELLPLSLLVTPNLDEARILTGVEVRDEAGMREAARVLRERGASAVLVKGGHLEGGEVVDVCLDGEGWATWRRPRIETRSGHGTGCTLSAAVAAGLALGWSLREAVESALAYTRRALAGGPALGAGTAPLNHGVSVPVPGRVADGTDVR